MDHPATPDKVCCRPAKVSPRGSDLLTKTSVELTAFEVGLHRVKLRIIL